jgi:hypothetical protein
MLDANNNLNNKPLAHKSIRLYIPNVLSRWTDLSSKHQVEIIRSSDLIASLGSLRQRCTHGSVTMALGVPTRIMQYLGVVALELLVQLGRIHVASRILDTSVLGSLLIGGVGISKKLIHSILKQMVGTMAHTSDCILDHAIGKLFNMTRSTNQ